MEPVYRWTIASLEHTVPDGGVTVAHWRVTAEDGGHTASAYGTVEFTPDPTSPDFIPYAGLTEADVLGWVWNSGVDKDATETLLATRIEEQKSPAVVSGLPWSARAEEPQVVSQPATS